MQDVITETTPGVDGASKAGVAYADASFDGRRGPLLRLCLVNLLLTLVTFGVYRFWARTHVRRYFWSHTRIGADRFEYTGTARELLLGFLVAVALIFVPAFAIEFLSPIAQSSGLGGVVYALNAVYGLGFACLVWAAIYRMWRYRLSRTLWRGVRFHLDGSTWLFVAGSLRRIILTTLSLWLAYPYFSIGQTRDIATNARFGTTRFSFDGSARSLLAPWLLHWAIAAASIAGVVALFALGAKAEGEAGTPVPGVVGVVVAIVIVAVSYTRYRVVEARYVLGHLRFAEARFESKLSTGATLRTLLLYLLALAGVFAVGILIGWGVFLLMVGALPIPADAAARPEDLAVQFAVPAALALGVVVLVVSMFSLSLKHVVLTFGFAHHVFSTLTVTNPQAFDRATQDTTAEMPRFGEGLAQGFDIGAF